MDNADVTGLTRWMEMAKSRRHALRGGLAITPAIGLLTGSAEVLAKKKRKKKRKKKPPLCAELCGFNCSTCFFRADAPPLCGGNGSTTCASCRSDNDCVSNDPSGECRSYCVIRTELRATGDTKTTCGPGAACDCDPGALGVCFQVDACGA